MSEPEHSQHETALSSLSWFMLLIYIYNLLCSLRILNLLVVHKDFNSSQPLRSTPLPQWHALPWLWKTLGVCGFKSELSFKGCNRNEKVVGVQHLVSFDTRFLILKLLRMWWESPDFKGPRHFTQFCRAKDGSCQGKAFCSGNFDY